MSRFTPQELICPDHDQVMSYSGIRPIFVEIETVDRHGKKQIKYMTQDCFFWKCPNCNMQQCKEKKKTDDLSLAMPLCYVCNSVRTYSKICNECRDNKIE